MIEVSVEITRTGYVKANTYPSGLFFDMFALYDRLNEDYGRGNWKLVLD